VAFKRPDGKKVLVVLNDGDAVSSFNLKYQEQQVVAVMPGRSVGTFVW
jgi:glucosylceramidase